MKGIKFLLVATFGLFAFNIIAMAACSSEQTGAIYSIETDTDTQYCPTLSDAFNEVKDNGTITLLENDTISQMVTTVPKTNTLDLNGNTITFSSANGLAVTNSKTVLTIKDSKTGGKITSTYSGESGTTVFAAIGSLTLESGTIEGSESNKNAALQVGQTASVGAFKMNGGTILNKSTAGWAAIFVTQGNVTIDAGDIKTDNSSSTGGTMWIKTGTVTINDGAISNVGTGSTIQSGMRSSGDVHLYINGGTITSDNTTAGSLALLIVKGDATISDSATLNSNSETATIQIGLNKDERTGEESTIAHLTLNGGKVENTKSTAILVATAGSDLTMTNGTVIGNSNGELNITAIVVGTEKGNSNNEKVGAKAIISDGTVDGGVGVFGKNSILEISGGEIKAKSFAVSGNGAETDNSTIVISGGTLISEENAAIYHPQTGSLSISDGTITGKIGIVARQGDINITGGTITATGSQDETVRVGDAKEGDDYVQLPTGTAIIVDNSETAYEGTAKVTVTGDKAIIEGSTQSILSYNDDKTTDFDITGGTFLSNGIRDDVTTFLTNHSNYGQSQSGLVGIVHNITKDIDTDKGTIESYDNATEGETVEFSVKTKSVDYAVDSVSVKTNDNQTVEYSSNNGSYSFVMPDKDVTISVKFKVVYAYYGSLNDALKEASSIDTSKYTEDSVKKLLEAIENAKNVSKSLKASQQYSIDTLTNALKTAIANLVLVNPSSSEEKPEEQTPNTYDAGLVYVELSIIALGTTLISIRKLRNN